ncbi:MAG: 30S ribosomal protein S20 [Verrucomicrobia bacterium]|nr:30S ribosomal protein S20 [Verrucomicrobiota bacterium]
MPNIQSAFKRWKQNLRRRAANYSTRNAIHTLRNQIFEVATSAENKTKVKDMYRKYSSLLDKAVKRGIITKNMASRSKSRATARIKKMPA